jgi:uncharacterized membrane protein YgcG
MSFWDIVWFIFISFAFVAYLMALFTIMTDIFRDDSLSGAVKAIWIVCLVFFPLITAVVYLLARGSGMAERHLSHARAVRQAETDYIRSVAASAPGSGGSSGGGGAGQSATAQIAEGKRLLDAGAITEQEYATLKAKALA